MHERVLLLGPTGVDKAQVVARLIGHVASCSRWSAATKQAVAQLRYVEFEKEYLQNAAAPWRSWAGFFNNHLATQNMFWKAAWDAFSPTIDDRVTILAMHAVFVSGVYGLRSACDIDRISSGFRPTLVITLIDDVFNIWRRTEQRAGGRDIRGRPSIEQLLSARRAEQLVGDMIALKASSADRPVPHILFAVGNSVDAFANLLISRARVTYLSFPISAPRRMMKDQDFSLEQKINEAHGLAQAKMVRDTSRCFISPLTIDELPFAKRAEKSRRSEFKFGQADRWSLTGLWGDDHACTAELPGRHEFSKAAVLQASAMISADVGWRDRRLVQQSDSLAIICPKDPRKNRITRGVLSEIVAAGGLGISCVVWQDPKWDAHSFVRAELASEAGTMGADSSRMPVDIVESLDDVIEAT